MKSFMWSLSKFSRRLASKKSSKRRKRKLVVLSSDTTRTRHGKGIGVSAYEFKDVKRHLEYDSDTPLINLKRMRKGTAKPSAHNDDPVASNVQRSYNEDAGPSFNEGSDKDYSGESSGVESEDDDESVKPQKEKLSFFCNRRRRQLAKTKDQDIAVGEVDTRNKKGKQAIPVYDLCSSTSVRITRAKTRALEVSAEIDKGKKEKAVKTKKRERVDKTWNDDRDLEPRRKRKRSKLNEWLGIRTRSTPAQLTRCIKILSREQRLAVKDMGLGRLLNLKMDGIPAKLGHYVVDNFNQETLQLTVPSGTLCIDAELVHKVLGIPIGGVSFNALERREAHDEGVAKWRQRYPPSRFISAKQMVDMIEKRSNGEDDCDFRMDFIMCFYTIMIDCHKQGSLKDNILEYITDDLDFAGMDWCELVVEVLKSCKNGWRRDSLDPPFTGPLTFLTLLYVDSFKCKGLDVDTSMDPMSFWTFQMLRDREKIEIKGGGFGLGRLKALYSYNDVKVGLDEPSVQERVSAVGDLVDVMIRSKKRAENAISKLCKDYPGREDVVAVKSRYDDFINEMVKMNVEASVERVTADAQIGNVLEEISKGKSIALEEDDCLNLGDSPMNKSPLTRSKTRKNQGTSDDGGAFESPILSQYRKTLHDSAKNNPGGISGLGNDDLAKNLTSEFAEVSETDGTHEKNLAGRDGTQERDDVAPNAREPDLVSTQSVVETENDQLGLEVELPTKNDRPGGDLNEEGTVEEIQDDTIVAGTPVDVQMEDDKTVSECDGIGTAEAGASTYNTDEQDSQTNAEAVPKTMDAPRQVVDTGKKDEQAAKTGNVGITPTETQTDKTEDPMAGCSWVLPSMTNLAGNDAPSFRFGLTPPEQAGQREIAQEESNVKDLPAKPECGYKYVEQGLPDKPERGDKYVEQVLPDKPECGDKTVDQGLTDNPECRDKSVELGLPGKPEYGDKSVEQGLPACNAHGKEKVDDSIGCSWVLPCMTKSDGNDAPSFSFGLTQPEEAEFVPPSPKMGSSMTALPVESGSASGGPQAESNINDLPAKPECVDKSVEQRMDASKGRGKENADSSIDADGVGTSESHSTPVYPMVSPISSYDAQKNIYNEYDLGGNMDFDDDHMTLAMRQQMIANIDAKKRNPLRERNVTYVHKSPFHIRGVDLSEGVTKDDDAMWKYVYMDEDRLNMLCGGDARRRVAKQNRIERGEGVENVEIPQEEVDNALANEVLFRSLSNVEATRIMFKSLKPGMQVLDAIVDCWVEVLNYEERLKSEGSSLRLFVSTKAVFPWMLNDANCDENTRMARFSSAMVAAVPSYEKKQDFKSFDIVFFPILERAHFYLLVFELKNIAILLIDSDKKRGRRRCKDHIDFHKKDTAYKYKHMFVKFLKSINHPKAAVIGGAEIHRFDVEWATAGNGTDCGVYLMRHMEKFMGLNVPFDCSFSRNGRAKEGEIKKLRTKYAAHILRSAVNTKKGQVEAGAVLRK